MITEKLIESKPEDYNEITLQGYLELAREHPKRETKVKKAKKKKVSPGKSESAGTGKKDTHPSKKCMPLDLLERGYANQ